MQCTELLFQRTHRDQSLSGRSGGSLGVPLLGQQRPQQNSVLSPGTGRSGFCQVANYTSTCSLHLRKCLHILNSQRKTSSSLKNSITKIYSILMDSKMGLQSITWQVFYEEMRKQPQFLSAFWEGITLTISLIEKEGK